MAEIEISMKVLEDEVMEFAQKLEQKYIERKMEKKKLVDKSRKFNI